MLSGILSGAEHSQFTRELRPDLTAEAEDEDAPDEAGLSIR